MLIPGRSRSKEPPAPAGGAPLSIGIVSFNLNIERIYTVAGFSAGGVFRSGVPAIHAGGKGVNAGRTLRTLSVPHALFGCAGGSAGRQIAHDLHASGLHAALARVSRESRTCLVVRDTACRRETVVNEPGPLLTRAEAKSVLVRCCRFISRHAVIMFSGSVVPGITPREYAGLIRTCRAAGKPVVVDCAGAYLKATISAGAQVVKPNLSEWEAVCGKRFSSVRDIVASARPAFSHGVRLMVISRGADGAYFIDKDSCREVRVPRLHTVNAVGCGDALAAAIAAGMTGKKDPLEYARYACAVAAASSLTELPGAVRKKDIAVILRKIRERQVL